MAVEQLSDVAGRDAACIHATCIAVMQCGVLFLGAPGSGKSTLALQMMALGADLVSDDRVILTMKGGYVVAEAPPEIQGLIEARGIGLLRAEVASATEVKYVVDLDHSEGARLPEHSYTQVLRQTVPLLRGADIPNLAAALMQLAKKGRVNPAWPNN
ncbi:HPr kinase/phosphorylase [Ruegeria arenilitoris]|uniref:HPr kinase/phosphorylase n=1 Tax=Ruegeria arenilitoris TaxID=1173585 RepID=UPI00147EBFE8|nr:HPr kinase/phosphatase C-terminal domain-containing protein [Ruegeria arenilitoris]